MSLSAMLACPTPPPCLPARSSGRYEGHFSDRGYNAVQLAGSRDCWIASVRIENADNGVLLYNASFTTLSGAPACSQEPTGLARPAAGRRIPLLHCARSCRRRASGPLSSAFSPSPCSAEPPPPADIVLSSKDRTWSDGQNVNGHHGISLTYGQSVLVTRWAGSRPWVCASRCPASAA